MISYPDEFPTTTKSSNSKKVDSFPSSYTEIRRFLSPSTSLTFLTALIPVLSDCDSLVHKEGIKDEYEWLECAYDNQTFSGYLELKTTQENINQLYDYLT